MSATPSSHPYTFKSIKIHNCACSGKSGVCSTEAPSSAPKSHVSDAFEFAMLQRYVQRSQAKHHFDTMLTPVRAVIACLDRYGREQDARAAAFVDYAAQTVNCALYCADMQSNDPKRRDSDYDARISALEHDKADLSLEFGYLAGSLRSLREFIINFGCNVQSEFSGAFATLQHEIARREADAGALAAQFSAFRAYIDAYRPCVEQGIYIGQTIEYQLNEERRTNENTLRALEIKKQVEELADLIRRVRDSYFLTLQTAACNACNEVTQCVAQLVSERDKIAHKYTDLQREMLASRPCIDYSTYTNDIISYNRLIAALLCVYQDIGTLAKQLLAVKNAVQTLLAYLEPLMLRCARDAASRASEAALCNYYQNERAAELERSQKQYQISCALIRRERDRLAQQLNELYARDTNHYLLQFENDISSLSLIRYVLFAAELHTTNAIGRLANEMRGCLNMMKNGECSAEQRLEAANQFVKHMYEFYCSDFPVHVSYQFINMFDISFTHVQGECFGARARADILSRYKQVKTQNAQLLLCVQKYVEAHGDKWNAGYLIVQPVL